MFYNFDSEGAMRQARKLAQELGYDDISSHGSIHITNMDEAFVTIYCHDDFQPRWNADNIQTGGIDFPMDSYGHVTTNGLLSREQRELSVLARRIGQDAELHRHMTTAFAKEFVARLLRDAKEFVNLLPPPQANALAQQLRVVQGDED